MTSSPSTKRSRKWSLHTDKQHNTSIKTENVLPRESVFFPCTLECAYLADVCISQGKKKLPEPPSSNC